MMGWFSNWPPTNSGVYGVCRTSDFFWETADWFQDYYAHQEPLLYGILDLNRYAKR